MFVKKKKKGGGYKISLTMLHAQHLNAIRFFINPNLELKQNTNNQEQKIKITILQW